MDVGRWIWNAASASLACFMLACSSGTACPTSIAAPNPNPGSAEASKSPGHDYSPFVVHVLGELPYDQISFKDVGMSLPEGDRVLHYESLAESVALALPAQLASELPHGLDARVSYDERIADPAGHLACDSGHIYVDVWRAGDGYGYSLWSGCGMADRFEHQDRASTDLEALGARIASSLGSAQRRQCYQRQC